MAAAHRARIRLGTREEHSAVRALRHFQYAPAHSSRAPVIAGSAVTFSGVVLANVVVRIVATSLLTSRINRTPTVLESPTACIGECENFSTTSTAEKVSGAAAQVDGPRMGHALRLFVCGAPLFSWLQKHPLFLLRFSVRPSSIMRPDLRNHCTCATVLRNWSVQHFCAIFLCNILSNTRVQKY